MDEVAGAIAVPVRREILLMLRAEPLSAGLIAGRFAISRPAVSRHLRVLREAGLVRDTVDGRRRVYALVTAPLGVKVAHALSKRTLEMAFGAYMFIVGGRFAIRCSNWSTWATSATPSSPAFPAA